MLRLIRHYVRALLPNTDDRYLDKFETVTNRGSKGKKKVMEGTERCRLAPKDLTLVAFCLWPPLVILTI